MFWKKSASIVNNETTFCSLVIQSLAKSLPDSELAQAGYELYAPIYETCNLVEVKDDDAIER